MKALFVAWSPTKPERASWRPVGRLVHDGEVYRFSYTYGARKPGFRPFQGMENLSLTYDSEELFPLFANRLLSESRPEYEAYLRWSGLDITNPPDPIVMLGITEGIRQTDAVEVFPCPTLDAVGCYINRFFLHGIQWLPPTAIERISRLSEGERLRIMLDLQNDYDSQAVAVRTEPEPTLIGYVPRYLARDVSQLVRSGSIELAVVRVNRDAPVQNRLLCHMRSRWPADFAPCSGEDFMPIPADVPARCSA
jgi:hypothetical protein